VDLVRFLAEYGAVAKARTEHGSTPLHFAVWAGRADLVRLLVEQGADATAQDSMALT
jgi:ankyrin repeat protein